MFLSSSTISSFGIAMLSGERKIDRERAPARGTLGENAAAMGFHDFLCDFQPQCLCAAPGIFGRPLDARFENSVGYVGRHARARVQYPYPQVAGFLEGTNDDFPSIG